MKTSDEILTFLSQNKNLLRDKYHIIRIGLFGSYARDDQNAKRFMHLYHRVCP